MEKKKQRNPVAKELLVNQAFKHKREKGYKQRLNEQEQQEYDKELKEYKSGKTTI